MDTHLNGHGRSADILRLPAEQDSGDPADRFSFIYPSDIKLQPRRWLVPGLLPRTGFGLLFGPSGCGKSFWGVHIGLSVALGNEVLGKKAKCAGVIYVAAEDAGGVQFRTVAWMQANHLDRDDFSPLPFAVVPEAPDLFSEENGDADALIAAIKREAIVLREIGAPPGLVIIDTYRDAMPGLEENDSRQTSTAVRTLRRIGEETDALVLVVAHTAKSGDGEDPRGSSALIGAADVALGVRLEEPPAVADEAPTGPPQRVLWVRKQRNGPDAKGDQGLRWAYKLRTVDLDVIGEDGHPERSCVVEIDEMARAPRPVKAVPLKAGSRTLEQAIINLLSNGKGQRPPADIPCPADRQAVCRDDVIAEATRLRIADLDGANPAEAVRKAVQRAKTDLFEKGRIIEIDGWIWRTVK